MADLQVPPIVELRLLSVFLSVSESGSMTAAAAKLGMTQSAVSQSLGLLERQLSVSLFERDRRPLQLTAAGNLLRERAPRILNQARQLPTMLQEISSTPLPDIRIGLVDSFAATAGPHLVRDLVQRTLHLSVYSGLSPFHNDALQRRLVDLVVTSDSLYDVDELERHEILTEPFMLLVSAQLAGDMKSLTLEQICARYPLIRYSARSHIGLQIERHLRRVNVTSPRTVEVDTSDTLVAMVAGGCGFALTTPLCFLQGRAHSGATAALPLPGPSFKRTLRLIAHAGAYAGLPGSVAAQSRHILNTDIVPELRKLVPWLGAEVKVPTSERVASELPARTPLRTA